MAQHSGVGQSSAVTAVESALPQRESGPLRRYARVLVLLDALCLLLAGLAGLLVRDESVTVALSIAVVAAVVPAWLIALALTGAYDARFLGVGTAEFTRVGTASMVVLAGTATVGYFASAASLRGELMLGIPLGFALLLVERRMARSWLHRRRARGHFAIRSLVIGLPDQVRDLVSDLADDHTTGLAVTEVMDPPAGPTGEWVSRAANSVAEKGLDAVVVAPGASVSREALRALAWRLSGTGTDLMVSPALGDLAGPRSLVRSAPRLPLVHLDEARLTKPQQALKRAGDIAASTLVLVFVLPVLAIIAGVVRITSPGPAFYRQQRVGRDGRVFTLTKVRTMVVGADAMHDEVLGPPLGRDPRLAVLDPRITRVGRFLRRWSLDEFPQLWSVIRGDMSLVGPRPLMPSEMPWLEPLGQRRHLMRPGVTGLWQVNGRKELDWADRIRLDVEYVERWSPALDAVLLVRTVKAVILGVGAR